MCGYIGIWPWFCHTQGQRNSLYREDLCFDMQEHGRRRVKKNQMVWHVRSGWFMLTALRWTSPAGLISLGLLEYDRLGHTLSPSHLWDFSLESQNHKGLKRPLRSSLPTSNSSPPCPLNHVSRLRPQLRPPMLYKKAFPDRISTWKFSPKTFMERRQTAALDYSNIFPVRLCMQGACSTLLMLID